MTQSKPTSTAASVPASEAVKPCVFIMAGGTGGHVFPGLAVAEALSARGYVVHWLGTERGLEARLVPAAGITLHCLEMQGLRGKGLRRYLTMPFVLLRAVRQAAHFFSVMRPVCVVGMGGYAAAPGGIAAFLRRIPLVLHEQNAVAGLTNRALAPLARKTLSAYPNQLTRKANSAVVGNPLRGSITAMPKPTERFLQRTGPLRLLVLGGSLGAQALNTFVPQALALGPEASRPIVWHQAGRDKVQGALAGYEKTGLFAQEVQADHAPPEEGIQVCAFIENMPAAYAWADLVLCRAGALTVSEISAVGVAAVFVPYPYAVDDHQTQNAQFLVDAGAALSLQESSLTADRLSQYLFEWLTDRAALLEKAERAWAAGQRQATEAVVAAILAVRR